MEKSGTTLVEMRTERPGLGPLSLPGHSAKSKPSKNNMKTAAAFLPFFRCKKKGLRKHLCTHFTVDTNYTEF